MQSNKLESIKIIPKGFLPIPLEPKNGKSKKAVKFSKDDRKLLDGTIKDSGRPYNEMYENAALELSNSLFIKNYNENGRLDGLNKADDIVNNADLEIVDKNSFRKDDMDLEIIRLQDRSVNDKLNDEITGDHGKEEEVYNEIDLHLIEGQEEDNDIGDGEFNYVTHYEQILVFKPFIFSKLENMTIQESKESQKDTNSFEFS